MIDYVDELEDALSQLLLRRNRSGLVSAALEHAPAGLDDSTYPVLSGIARIGPTSITRLAREIGLDRSGASRYADRLVDIGLLVRRDDANDARAAVLALTGRGRRAIARCRADLKAHLAEVTGAMPARDRRALVAGLRALTSGVLP